jgi:antitoxin ParD1/3/4
VTSSLLLISRIGIRTQDSAKSNISISLPDDLKAYVDEQIAKAGYAFVSEYLLALVQREQQRNQAIETLDDLLTEGLDSLEDIEATDDWWEQERQNLIQQHQGSYRCLFTHEKLVVCKLDIFVQIADAYLATKTVQRERHIK